MCKSDLLDPLGGARYETFFYRDNRNPNYIGIRAAFGLGWCRDNGFAGNCKRTGGLLGGLWDNYVISQTMIDCP